MPQRPESIDLTNLAVVRDYYSEQRDIQRQGWKALHDAAVRIYKEDSRQRFGAPVAANTFRAFLSGDSLPSNISGMMAYFSALGATDADLRIIRSTLDHEIKNKLSRGSGASRDIPSLKEATVRDVETKLIPLMTEVSEMTGWSFYVTLQQHLTGLDSKNRGDTYPKNEAQYGLLHYLMDLYEKTTNVTRSVTEKDIMRDDLTKVDKLVGRIKKLAEEYKNYLVDHYVFAQMVLAPKIHMADVGVARDLLQEAKTRSNMCMKDLYDAIRSLHEIVFVGIRDSDIYIAAEIGTESVICHVHSYCTNVVYGSMGTSALYSGVYLYRQKRQFSTDDISGGKMPNAYQELEEIWWKFVSLNSDGELSERKLSELFERFRDYQKGVGEPGKRARELWSSIWVEYWLPDVIAQALHRPYRALRRKRVIGEDDARKMLAHIDELVYKE